MATSTTVPPAASASKKRHVCSLPQTHSSSSFVKPRRKIATTGTGWAWSSSNSGSSMVRLWKFVVLSLAVVCGVLQVMLLTTTTTTVTTPPPLEGSTDSTNESSRIPAVAMEVLSPLAFLERGHRALGAGGDDDDDDDETPTAQKGKTVAKTAKTAKTTTAAAAGGDDDDDDDTPSPARPKKGAKTGGNQEKAKGGDDDDDDAAPVGKKTKPKKKAAPAAAKKAKAAGDDDDDDDEVSKTKGEKDFLTEDLIANALAGINTDLGRHRDKIGVGGGDDDEETAKKQKKKKKKKKRVGPATPLADGGGSNDDDEATKAAVAKAQNGGDDDDDDQPAVDKDRRKGVAAGAGGDDDEAPVEIPKKKKEKKKKKKKTKAAPPGKAGGGGDDDDDETPVPLPNKKKPGAGGGDDDDETTKTTKKKAEEGEKKKKKKVKKKKTGPTIAAAKAAAPDDDDDVGGGAAGGGEDDDEGVKPMTGRKARAVQNVQKRASIVGQGGGAGDDDDDDDVVSGEADQIVTDGKNLKKERHVKLLGVHGKRLATNRKNFSHRKKLIEHAIRREMDDRDDDELRFAAKDFVLPDDDEKSLTQDDDDEYKTQDGQLQDMSVLSTAGSLVYAFGIVRDTQDIVDEVFSQLMVLNCVHMVGVHILAGTGVKALRTRRTEFVQRELIGSTEKCAPFVVKKQPKIEEAEGFINRIDRTAELRDVQRMELASIYQASQVAGKQSQNVVILVDFDLVKLPSNDVLMEEAARMMHYHHHDAVCAMGITHFPYGYYDTFSTIFVPTTFTFPRKHRLIQNPNMKEDLALVRSDDVFGDTSPIGLLNHFRDSGAKSLYGTVPVRSCFGGLTIYRASTYFTDDCQYLRPAHHLMVFATYEDARPSEHVAFHDCLFSDGSKHKIAVSPRLKAYRDEPETYGHQLLAGGNIHSGLAKQDGLVTISSRAKKGSRLVNGIWSLRINELGHLVVEKNTPGLPVEETWRASVFSYYFQPYWSMMYLILSSDGLLVLVQQVPRGETTLGEGVCEPIEKDSNECRLVLWTSGVSGTMEETEYSLFLLDTGVLIVAELNSRSVLWTNDPRLPPDVMEIPEDVYQPKPTPMPVVKCISSGDQDDINEVLQEVGDVAVLCPNAVFELTGPVKFTMDAQKVYTEGFPTDDSRAILRLKGRAVTNAVEMNGRSHVELRHVQVDGSREKLGILDGDALINAGGLGTGQILKSLKVYGTRSWSTIHVQEGVGGRCYNTLIEDSEIGPAGDEASSAHGITMACTMSLIRNNRFVDNTASAVMLFGAPGTTVSQNVVVSETLPALAGFALVHLHPYNGDFTNTVVRENQVQAMAPMRVAIAVGPALWFCQNRNHVIFGGIVTKNVLSGKKMRFGIAVDGVRDFVVNQNVDEATHVAVPGGQGVDCQGEGLSEPRGFQYNIERSSGVFQPEFEAGVVENAAHFVG